MKAPVAVENIQIPGSKGASRFALALNPPMVNLNIRLGGKVFPENDGTPITYKPVPVKPLITKTTM